MVVVTGGPTALCPFPRPERAYLPVLGLGPEFWVDLHKIFFFNLHTVFHKIDLYIHNK